MNISLREPQDLDRLRSLIAREKVALQRERYRAVLLAFDGLEGNEVAQRIGRSPRFVDEWVGRYRRGGLCALTPRKPRGATPKLTAGQIEQLKARLEAGPRPEDRVCSLRGKDIVRILEEEFGVKHTLGSIYGVLDRIGYSCLKPRPRHEKNDPAVMEAFRQHAPFLSRR